ncbi:hypothetical protein C8R45DRAFT_885421 [Mycena sanguinolenta]|nr:hypothetical protein C8R45DRAFT_885421 [Mycena sanguinolenta]
MIVSTTAQPSTAQLPHAQRNPPARAVAAASSSTSPTSLNHERHPAIENPALLSHIAQAFPTSMPRADRVKHGLTYHDAFTGRDTIDHLARILNTTDRNLAHLVGRALDAQGVFRDVECGHRLRDSVVEVYRFWTRLSVPVRATGAEEEEEDEAPPNGIFTLLTHCYSPRCSADSGQLCYSVVCPNRREEQARLGMRPRESRQVLHRFLFRKGRSLLEGEH